MDAASQTAYEIGLAPEEFARRTPAELRDMQRARLRAQYRERAWAAMPWVVLLGVMGVGVTVEQIAGEEPE